MIASARTSQAPGIAGPSRLGRGPCRLRRCPPLRRSCARPTVRPGLWRRRHGRSPSGSLRNTGARPWLRAPCSRTFRTSLTGAPSIHAPRRWSRGPRRSWPQSIGNGGLTVCRRSGRLRAGALVRRIEGWVGTFTVAPTVRRLCLGLSGREKRRECSRRGAGAGRRRHASIQEEREERSDEQQSEDAQRPARDEQAYP